MKNKVLEIFDPIDAFWGGARAKTFFKRGLYCNFNDPFIGF